VSFPGSPTAALAVAPRHPPLPSLPVGPSPASAALLHSLPPRPLLRPSGSIGSLAEGSGDEREIVNPSSRDCSFTRGGDSTHHRQPTTPRELVGYPPQASPPPPLPQSRRGVAFSDSGGSRVLDLGERPPSDLTSPRKSLRRAKSGSTGSLVSLVTSWTPWGRKREDDEDDDAEGEEGAEEEASAGVLSQDEHRDAKMQPAPDAKGATGTQRRPNKASGRPNFTGFWENIYVQVMNFSWRTALVFKLSSPYHAFAGLSCHLKGRERDSCAWARFQLAGAGAVPRAGEAAVVGGGAVGGRVSALPHQAPGRADGGAGGRHAGHPAAGGSERVAALCLGRDRVAQLALAGKREGQERDRNVCLLPVKPSLSLTAASDYERHSRISSITRGGIGRATRGRCT
jgi:hypothetical protein